MDVNTILNNPTNLYFGHGTGIEDENIVNSIFNNGLRCSHGSLYFTSAILGIGGNINESEAEMLKQWPHKNSKIIIVVSLPIKYRILDSPGIGTYNMADAAYYYIPNKEIRDKYALTDSPYVMPEFIAGYYDARSDSYVANPKYFENLSSVEQENLFAQVKQKYFNIIEESVGIDNYKEILKEINGEFPLSESEISLLRQTYKENKLLSKISTELLNKKVKVPGGMIMSAEEYLQRFVISHLANSEFIVLKNGAKIPTLHFIIECVLYDCQERYDGNFAKYLEENVDSIIESKIEQPENLSPKF